MKLIKDLLKEGKKWSLSRIVFIIILIVGIHLAYKLGDIPTGVVTLQGALLAYVFAGKTKHNTLNAEEFYADSVLD